MAKHNKKADLILLIFLYGVFPSEESAIHMLGSPSTVKEGLTDDVTLRCSLNDTASSAGIVGRRDVTILHDDANGIRDTPYNVDEVMSIIITQAGRDLAVLTHTHPARVVDNSTNLQISGQISKPNVGEAYIELKWHQPTEVQMGDFECQINAITEFGRAVLYSSSFSFGFSLPTIMDLVRRVQHLEAENQAMNTTYVNKINDLETENSAMNTTFVNKINDLETENSAMNTTFVNKINDLETENSAMNKTFGNKIQDLETQNHALNALVQENSDEISLLKNCTTPRVAFMVTTDNTSFIIPGLSVVVFDVVLTNIGDSYNTSTGIYQFNVHGMTRPDNYLSLELKLNGRTVTSVQSETPNDKTKLHGDASSAVMHLGKGDTVTLVAPARMDLRADSYSNRSNMYSGVLLQSDACLGHDGGH